MKLIHMVYVYIHILKVTSYTNMDPEMIDRLFTLYKNGMNLNDIHKIYLNNDDELFLILTQEFKRRNDVLIEEQKKENTQLKKENTQIKKEIADMNSDIDYVWLELYETMKKILALSNNERERICIFVDSAERLLIPQENRQQIYDLLTQDLPLALY